MANGCDNHLELTTDHPILIKKLKGFLNSPNNDLGFLSTFVPLKNNESPKSAWGVDRDIPKSLIKIESMTENDGFFSLTLYFQSAWLPPIAFFRKLSQMYSTSKRTDTFFDLSCDYAECGCQVFGSYSFTEGDELLERYRYSDLLSKDKKMLAYYNEIFGLDSFDPILSDADDDDDTDDDQDK